MSSIYKVRTDVKERLKKHNKSIADLARHLQRNYDVVSAYLNGRRKIPEMMELRLEGYFKDLENAPI